MIEIKDLKKDYLIEDVKINALKGITCKLPKRGMIFIVGKSGSGKSTLLNLLGGLDDITSGNIIVDGKSINDFSKRDFDEYRNQYIGFIFQDYNLIENISIYENIKIALSFQGIDAENIIHQTLSDVGLENIKDRKPKALSGGQQQRIVIARALVKNSKIILADEPTGNLDSETAYQIFSLLKRISQERLVIVVSHDKESAYQFGDRIIELKDGVIASDLEKNNISNDKNEPSIIKKEKIKLSNRFFLHIGLSNIKTRLWRTFFSITLLTIAILITVSSIIMSSYSTEKGIFLTISKNKDEYIYFYDSYRDHYGKVTKSYRRINRKLLDELINNQNYVIRTNRIHTITTSEGNYQHLYFSEYIDSIQDLVNFGFEFYEGYQEIDNDSIVVSDFYVESILRSSNNPSSGIKYFIKKGEEEIILDANTEFQDLIGEEINNYRSYFGEKVYGTPFRISAIYKTDYHLYNHNDGNKSNEYENWLEKKRHIYIKYEKRPNYEVEEYSDSGIPLPSELDELNYRLEIILGNKYINQMKLDILGINTLTDDQKHRILTANGFLSEDFVLKDDEIIINLDMYNLFFNQDFKADYYISDGNINKIPEHLGKQISYNIYDKDYQEYVLVQNARIIGVEIADSPDRYFKDRKIYINVKNRGKIQELIDNNFSVISLYTNGNYRDLSNLLLTYSENNFLPVFNYSTYFYTYEVGINQMRSLMISIGLGVLLISFLLITNLILISISANKKEIGILKALGGSNNTIYKIYLTESMIIGFCSLIIGIALFPFLNIFLNRILCPKDYNHLQFFAQNLLALLFIILTTIIIPLFATILPIRKIVKMTPMKSIRNT